ncbi:NADPH-dependent assimilatory sulfite reductase hemoprotein subunit [Chryseobacterium carnipullorum]|uniref:NADPH-dependent assimilatory sulfite reductase hemoprotein subunit n=1 Tax=Chryseobacterium carnipullorum TaxID=1124835 RepID=A0A376EP30_CHRCU|nr:NADPH-dependent assimilatory sulfite reductase hemoprotein subunit [Chryseobacterium carnipullorum]AZA47764.1 NADPH-dependent assimilatory sulfite reductase hemoprotein subunit [Chryseobacterium carnipullorum]AZA67087.1 NADPH-dependent assimilatory sulfite reductase hemoprotein subunit [Chryseobacterium carnipullorum]STD11819.1 Sulfite reductase [NADPH] hemoprotein beta-component [Chryseobacterium carnipullorum]
MTDKNNLSPVERIKTGSNGLRGTLKESLSDDFTGAIREDDQTLIKFHGMYQQDDRDRREERVAKKLEWLYSYMIRLRLPGGFLTSGQWAGLHEIAENHSTGVIKITTRQTIQLHGILKSHVKPTIQNFNLQHLDSIAACGDVNRNVTCTSNPSESPLHQQIYELAGKISEMCLPKTKSYYDLWIDDELVIDRKTEEDPLYQDRYLPRKLKIGIAIPPNNDVDVFINDIALIAIIENNQIVGYNIAAGGGLGATHGNDATYARLASLLGFVDTEEKALKAVYEIITVQRDFGNRSDRKLSRLKYTIDKLGIEGYRTEVEKRCGFAFEPAREFKFEQRKDRYGWVQNHEGKWFYTVFVEHGRILDIEGYPLKSGLLKIAETGKVNFRFTCNQNLILSDIHEQDKGEIEEILKEHGISGYTDEVSALRKNSVACVALNTCSLALAEGQRYLPVLVTKIEPVLKKYGLQNEDITIRMTGCPNGCGRSPNAEIGLVGTAYGKYNLHIGGDRLGMRLNTKFKENIGEEEILETLDELFGIYSEGRYSEETFGDFSYRYLQTIK